MPTLHVNLPAQSYDIEIAPELLAELGERVREIAPHEKAMLAVDRRIAETHGRSAANALARAGFQVVQFVLDADERQKSLATIRQMYDAMVEANLERSSPVIALGGGVIGDMAGFAAATYLRGVPLVQVPTTLLAMVDAAIGGKTAVNIELPDGSLGKNLIGAFWQPRLVICDPHVLKTLDERDFRCGLAESVKHALIAGNMPNGAAEGPARLLDRLDEQRDAILQHDEAVLSELIHHSAAVKVAIVSEDEREAGVRALLNLGHTFAHAIEPIAELDLRHGESVAIGICAAGSVSRERKMLDSDDFERIETTLGAFGLPTRLPQPVEIDRLMNAMRYDKKVAGGELRLILMRGLGRAEIAGDVPREMIEAAWRYVGAA